MTFIYDGFSITVDEFNRILKQYSYRNLELSRWIIKNYGTKI